MIGFHWVRRAPLRVTRAGSIALVCVAIACAMPFGARAATPIPATGPTKVALVIGNAGYDGADHLMSPLNDAKLIGQTLRGLGFETHIALDVTLDEFRNEVDWLSGEASTASVVVFYFAGHGFESEGDNFLVPIHSSLPIGAMTHVDLLAHAVRLDAVRASIRRGKPSVIVSMIDACRVPARGGPISVLKRDQAVHGELIAYSTADRGLAYDSMRTFGVAADDSPFAWYLASNLKQPGATIKQALEHTQQQVVGATDGSQQPWIASGLDGDFTMSDTGHLRAQMANSGVQRLAPLGLTRDRPMARGVSVDDPAGSDASRVRVPDPLAQGQAQGQDDEWSRLDDQITERARHPDVNMLKRLRQEAGGGDPVAMTTLGLVYENGSGVTRNPHEAIRLYTRAANQHFPIAQTLLGEAYIEGHLIPADFDRGESLLAQAAGTGFGRAKIDLADVRMRRGQGTDEDNARVTAEALLDQFRRAVATIPH